MVNSRVVLGALCVVVLGACDRGESKAGPSCDTAAAQIVSALTKGEKSVSSMEAKGKLVKTCTDTKWPEPARTCFGKAQSRDDVKTCEHDTLTGAQADKLGDASSGLGSLGSKQALAKMKEFADKLCACHDAKCAQDVTDEMTKWSQEMAKDSQEPPKMSDEEMKQATDIGQRMGECMTKAMGAGLPPTDVPPPGNPDDLNEGDRTPDGRVINK
jgi:hypothetical protein